MRRTSIPGFSGLSRLDGLGITGLHGPDAGTPRHPGLEPNARRSVVNTVYTGAGLKAKEDTVSLVLN